MGKHSKKEDFNTKPYDETASPETKAREFDQQYGQNRKSTNTPALDQYNKGKK